MKIGFSFQNNNLSKPQQQKVSFGAGLTREIAREIRNADVLAISDRLAKKGIPTDFKGNKVIAWCSEKTVEIFQQLNERFGLKLALPKGIYVEDFADLNVTSPTMTSFCNLQPSKKLRKNSNERIEEGVVFFNTFETIHKQASPLEKWRYDWKHINRRANVDYENNSTSTNLFLFPFFHEFTHSAHINRLLKKIQGEVLAGKVEKVYSQEGFQEYLTKYGGKIAQICKYALENPFEAIACDAPRIIVNSLNPKTLEPTKHPFINTPYENLHFWQPKRIRIPEYSDQDRPLTEILRNFWNGKFD